MIAVSHTLLCRGKSLTVVFLAFSMNSSKSVLNGHTCRACQKLILPLAPLITFKVFAVPSLSQVLQAVLNLHSQHSFSFEDWLFAVAFGIQNNMCLF